MCLEIISKSQIKTTNMSARVCIFKKIGLIDTLGLVIM